MARMPPTPDSARRRTIAAVTICAAAFLYPFPYQPQITNPNENVRFFMTAAIVQHGTYAIDEVRNVWGWVNDAAVYEGHYYSVKAPGTSLLGVPGFWLYAQITELRGQEVDRVVALWMVRMTGSALPMLIFLYFFHGWLSDRRAPPVLRDAVFISVALGSLLYAYSLIFVSHALSAATSFGAFMILERARHRGHISGGHAFAAGLLAASTTAFEYPGFVATVILCFYALACVRPWSRLAPFALGAVIPTAAVLHFHWACFDNPLTPGHRYLENPEFRELAQEGFFGASEVSTEAMGNLLFNVGYGLFPLTPVLLFAFLGFPALLAVKRTRLDALVALAIPVATWLLISFMNNWRGGWTVGPRYLALAVPFLGYAALEGGRVLSRSIPKLTGSFFVGSAAAGLIASGGPSAWYPHMPEAFTRPISQLMRLLVRHDFAPYNLGSYLSEQFGSGDYFGSRSMLPLSLLGLFAVFWIAWAERRMADRLLILIGTSFVSSTLLSPIVMDDPSAAGVSGALEYITDHWDPVGHDVAARLETRAREEELDAHEWGLLVRTYEEEGRTSAARSAERRARMAGFDELPPPPPPAMK